MILLFLVIKLQYSRTYIWSKLIVSEEVWSFQSFGLQNIYYFAFYKLNSKNVVKMTYNFIEDDIDFIFLKSLLK